MYTAYGNQTVLGGKRFVRAARHELEFRRTRAVAQGYRACKLNEITSADFVFGQERE